MWRQGLINSSQASAKTGYRLTGPANEIADRIEAALTRIAAARPVTPSGESDTVRRLRELEAVVERSIGELDTLLEAR